MTLPLPEKPQSTALCLSCLMKLLVLLARCIISSPLTMILLPKQNSQKGDQAPSKIFGYWTKNEHHLFIRGCIIHGWGKWNSIIERISTRDNLQVKSHAVAFGKRHPEKKQELIREHASLLHGKKTKQLCSKKNCFNAVKKSGKCSYHLRLRCSVVGCIKAAKKGEFVTNMVLPFILVNS